MDRLRLDKSRNMVKRLQARIAKACREGNERRMKSLQRLLTHSKAAKILAVQRVVGNKGGKTPGVDGVVWKTPRDRSQAILSLKKEGYHPLPLRRIYIPKKNGSLRPLGIPTMQDRAMQALVRQAKVCQKLFNVTNFREVANLPSSGK